MGKGGGLAEGVRRFDEEKRECVNKKKMKKSREKKDRETSNWGPGRGFCATTQQQRAREVSTAGTKAKRAWKKIAPETGGALSSKGKIK